MCGIAGAIARRGTPPLPREPLIRMVAMQRHRGPDGLGIYRDDQVALGHARRALVDLAGGQQPLGNEDGTVWLTGNGELFDHRARRAELQQLGHRFRTGSDLETIVHAYEQWGIAAFDRLAGQYAFALWDRRTRQLHLVRDPFGILPLHYARTADRLLFASEAKGLFASGDVAATFDPIGLQQVFTCWAALPPRTVFAGVAALRPGEVLTVDEALRTSSRRRFLAGPAAGPPPADLDAAAATLHGVLAPAVAERLAADVPVGSYLSGGLDSSVLAALAVRERPGLPTFGLGFTDPAFDESAAQAATAAALGCHHQSLLVDPAAIRAHLPAVAWHAEAPLLRTAAVPMFLLARSVAAAGLRAVLSGEGADELLAGYSLFQEDRLRRYWARQPESTRRPQLFARLHGFVADQATREAAMWRQFYAHRLLDTADPFYAHRLRWRTTAWTSRCLHPDLRAAAGALDLDAAVTDLLPPDFAAGTPLGRASAVEIATFLSPCLLAGQGDRMAMAHGVEVRYPFLADAVVATCRNLREGQLRRGLGTKLVLRRLATRLLPATIAARPKIPYRAPVGSALLGGDDPVCSTVWTARALAATGLVDVDAALALWQKAQRQAGQLAEREAMALCGVTTLQLLAEHLRRLPDHLDAADRHAARQGLTVDHDSSPVFSR